jgi:hypothetical protein
MPAKTSQPVDAATFANPVWRLHIVRMGILGEPGSLRCAALIPMHARKIDLAAAVHPGPLCNLFAGGRLHGEVGAGYGTKSVAHSGGDRADGCALIDEKRHGVHGRTGAGRRAIDGVERVSKMALSIELGIPQVLNRVRKKGESSANPAESVPPGLKPCSICWLCPGVKTPGSLRIEVFRSL